MGLTGWGEPTARASNSTIASGADDSGSVVAGTLEANEARKAVLASPAAARIEALAVKFTGMDVEEGETLVTLFSPELAAKSRYLRAATGAQTNMAAFTTTRPDVFTATLAAPIGGTVIERAVVPGQYVVEGEKLLTIVDASVLWFRFDVYERQLPWFQPGQKILVRVPNLTGKALPAVISFMEPSLNDATRTVKVRAEVENPVISTNGYRQRLLRFGMCAEARLTAETEDTLTVPRSAVLYPGGAAYAYVEKGDGAYERRRLRLGRQGDTLWEVLEGVEEGERVVTSGNVLIDAQAQFSQGESADEAMPEGMAEAESEPVEELGPGDPVLAVRSGQTGASTAALFGPAQAAAGPISWRWPTGSAERWRQTASSN
jgi:Cu(I)/Ag(I) efflux system membrane fusion protein